MGMLGDFWRFATGGAAPASGRRKRAQTESLTSEVMCSYRPGAQVALANMGGSNDTPPLMQVLWDVERMLSHPRVAACLDFYKGGIAGAKFSIEDASGPDVADFALTEIRRFWQRGRQPAQRSYEYGRGACEITYEEEEGLLRLSRLRAFMPLDCRVLLKDGEYVGVRLRGSVRGVTGDLWGPGLLPAKAFWLAHNKKYSRWYGWPCVYSAWRPWNRLAGRDNGEEALDGAVYRFGAAPAIGRYPPDDQQPNPARWGQNGQPGPTEFVSNRDLSRQMVESMTARMAVALSSRRDEHGQYVWDLQGPDKAFDPTGLIDYNKYLEDAISLGIGVPPELLQAEESGSGYSGRQIPLEAFLAGQQRNAEELAEAWHTQIGAPLLRWNFGPGAWARVKVEDLLESRLRQQGGTPGQAPPGGEKPAGPPGQGQQGQPPPKPQGPKPQNFGQNFSAEFEAKHPRDRGRFAEKAGKATPEEATAHYDSIKARVGELSVGEIRAEAAHLEKSPRASLAAVLTILGYPADGTRKGLASKLLDNLLSLKISYEQTRQIRESKPQNFSAAFVESEHPRDALGEFAKAKAAHAERSKVRESKKADADAKSKAAERLAATPLPSTPADAAQTLSAWETHGESVLAGAQEAGADERTVAKLARIVERGKDAAAVSAAKVARAKLGVEAVDSARAALGERPEEPADPVYTDDMDEATEAKTEAEHDAATAKYEKASEKWDAASEKLDAKEEKASEALEATEEAAREAFDAHAEKLNGAAGEAGEELRERHDEAWSALEDEGSNDPEPEPPEEEGEEGEEGRNGHRFSADFEAKHTRDHGKFSKKPGADATASKASAVLEFAKAAPAKLVAKVKEQIAKKYASLSARYGTRYAKAIIAAGIAGLPVPLPGSSFITAAPVVVLAELHRMFSRNESSFGTPPESMTEAEIEAAAEELIRELSAAFAEGEEDEEARKFGHRFSADFESKHTRDKLGEFAKKGDSGAKTAKADASKTNKDRAKKAPAKAPAVKGEMVSAKRIGKGKDAKILMDDGSEAPAHIKPSMVPPDWSDVKIGMDPDADVRVTGRDNKGRPKTVYRDDFHMRNAAIKFARTQAGLAERDSMSEENQHNRESSDPKIREAADCTWLMQEQATRPGSDNDTGGKVKAYGATTLRAEHVEESEDGVRLHFIGKEGVEHNHVVRDSRLAAMLLDRKRSADQRGGKLFATDYDKVAAYAKTLDTGRFSPKDWRTIRANTLAIAAIDSTPEPTTAKEYKERVKAVAEKVSGVLGNRPAQALESYIDPAVFSGWRVAANA